MADNKARTKAVLRQDKEQEKERRSIYGDRTNFACLGQRRRSYRFPRHRRGHNRPGENRPGEDRVCLACVASIALAALRNQLVHRNAPWRGSRRAEREAKEVFIGSQKWEPANDRTRKGSA